MVRALPLKDWNGNLNFIEDDSGFTAKPVRSVWLLGSQHRFFEKADGC
jgi:hypothetical protein